MRKCQKRPTSIQAKETYYNRHFCTPSATRMEEDTCVPYEEEGTCMSYEDRCMSHTHHFLDLLEEEALRMHAHHHKLVPLDDHNTLEYSTSINTYSLLT